MEDVWRHLDAELVRRWQRGDPTAFEALVRRWQAPVARFLARLAPRPELVPDLCQDVFLRLYRAGPRYREAGVFSTWLYRIALNVARDAGRRRRHEPLPLQGHEPPAPLPSVADACEREEIARSVAEAVAELPAPLREVLVLRHYEEMNFERMSRLLGTPASTLKSRFAAALARLRERLRHLDWSHEESEP
jgi:RNA polymerase sigma-70 factor (ECF subfamily)